MMRGRDGKTHILIELYSVGRPAEKLTKQWCEETAE